LFCLHPAGGSAMAYFPLSQELQGFHVYGLEDISESGEEGLYAHASIDEMAQGIPNKIKDQKSKIKDQKSKIKN
jgi:thioesterase domain-containing protein